MIRYEKEIKCGFNKLIDFVLYKNKNGIFTLIYNDKSIKTEFITLFETDNGFYFEEDDPRYEEFNAIDFKNLETGEEFLIDYNSMPKEVWCNGERIL